MQESLAWLFLRPVPIAQQLESLGKRLNHVIRKLTFRKLVPNLNCYF